MAGEPESQIARATLVHTGYSQRARWPNAGFMHAVETKVSPKAAGRGYWPELRAA